MKTPLFILCTLLFCQTLVAQTTIRNPDYVHMNFRAEVTKVEIFDTKTILHFKMEEPIGYRFSIPSQTYIEDVSGRGQKLYITKSQGIKMEKWHTISSSNEMTYKLFFPPLPKGVKKINYGESNTADNWFIYSLDISKNGSNFLNPFSHSGRKGNRIVMGYPTSNEMQTNNSYSLTENNHYKTLSENTLTPQDLPDTFFGNWYDKYGTLILIATPDYLVLNSMVQYYRDIKKISDTKFIIQSTRIGFEVLSIEGESMTIRTDRLRTLERKQSDNKVPEHLKGNWLHWAKIKEIKVTDDHFINNDHGQMGVYDVIEHRIDQVAKSDPENIIWFVLYREGNYKLYKAYKSDGEYTLVPRGYANARYKKVKH